MFRIFKKLKEFDRVSYDIRDNEYKLVGHTNRRRATPEEILSLSNFKK